MNDINPPGTPCIWVYGFFIIYVFDPGGVFDVRRRVFMYYAIPVVLRYIIIIIAHIGPADRTRAHDELHTRRAKHNIRARTPVRIIKNERNAVHTRVGYMTGRATIAGERYPP